MHCRRRNQTFTSSGHHVTLSFVISTALNLPPWLRSGRPSTQNLQPGPKVLDVCNMLTLPSREALPEELCTYKGITSYSLRNWLGPNLDSWFTGLPFRQPPVEAADISWGALAEILQNHPNTLVSFIGWTQSRTSGWPYKEPFLRFMPCAPRKSEGSHPTLVVSIA